MNAPEAATLVRAKIREHPELRHGEPRGDCPYQGFCYIATAAFCHLTNATPYRDERGEHYWAEVDGERWDLTAEQFDGEVLARLYATGRPTRFKGLSGRTMRLLDA